MPEFVLRSPMPVSAQELYAWHTRPGALERLLPPDGHVTLLRGGNLGLREGAQAELLLRLGPFSRRWVLRHLQIREGSSFLDKQTEGPFAEWNHTHRFVPESAQESWMEDAVEYRLPWGWAGRPQAERLVRRTLERAFHFRQQRLRQDLRRHALHRQARPWRIAVSGAGGLVGRALCAYLSSAGHSVLRLARPGGMGAPLAVSGEIPWRPEADLEPASLAGLDAVVHLAGASLAGGRWSARRKEEIWRSRVQSTQALCESLARGSGPPPVLVCASAVGFYGNRPEGVADEDTPAGSGFLAELCQAWEGAADPARRAGLRVAHLRLGLVLAREGGALAPQLLPFSLGLGGPLGAGRQGISWIALDDVLGALEHVLFTPGLAGPVNAVAPAPVEQREFARALGRVLHRPAGLPLPAAALRLTLGEMGQALLLEGARVLPTRLQRSGFAFLLPELEPALRWELGLPQEGLPGEQPA